MDKGGEMSRSEDAHDESGGGDHREAIREVARALRALHRELVDMERQRYESMHGAVGSPGAMLNLLLHDDEFAWMRLLSELMVDIDELLDVNDINPVDGAAVRREVELLIAPLENEASEFSSRYRSALQREATLVMTHSRVRAAIAKLPTIGTGEEVAVRDARPQWSPRRQESRKNRRR